MAGIGVPELFILLAIAIILFGPARLSGIGKALGEAIRSFRQATQAQKEPTATDAQPALGGAQAPAESADDSE
jgi:sec-independent protein translocase protein TatA